MPVALLLGDVQDNVRRILLANAIPVVPGATDRMVQPAEPQSSPKKVRFPSRVTYNQLLIPQGQKLLDLTPPPGRGEGPRRVWERLRDRTCIATTIGPRSCT